MQLKQQEQSHSFLLHSADNKLGELILPLLIQMINSLIPIIFSYIFFLTNIVSPQLGFILTFISPIFFIHYLKHPDRVKNSDIIAFIAILTTALYSPVIPLYFLLIVIIPSILITEYYKGNITINPLITAPIPLLVVATLILTFFTNYKLDLISMIVENIKLVTSAISPDQLLTDQGAKLVYIKNNAEQIATIIVHLLPATSFAYLALITFSTNRFYYKKYELKPLTYKVPEKLLIPLIIGGFMIMLQAPLAQWISYNTLIIFATMFFLQGFEVLNLFFNKYKVSIFIRIIAYIMLFSEPIIMLMLSAVGLADNWLDFNKKLRESGDKAQKGD